MMRSVNFSWKKTSIQRTVQYSIVQRHHTRGLADLCRPRVAGLFAQMEVGIVLLKYVLT